MVITLVMDQYGLVSNGTTATARSLANQLRSKGHKVNIVTCVPNSNEENIHIVKERKYPIITPIIRSHGMVLAKPDEKVLEQTIKESDIVHFFLPFKLAAKGKEVADRLGVASSAAFHLQPENITYNVKLNKLNFLHTWLYKRYKKFFDKFSDIHVPSKMIDDILGGYEYSARRHVISNGVLEDFKKLESVEKPLEFKDKFIVAMSGRLSNEKRQELLIEAIAKSKHEKDIQLILCGRGPTEQRLRELADKMLTNKAVIKFCNRQDLIETLNYCDLYAHTSEVELEAISCMEAFSCGLVPIISDADSSATKQFALHEQNLFKKGDSTSLRDKIDWFIDNPDKLKDMSQEYLEYSRNYKVKDCVNRLEEVFLKVISDNEIKKQNINKEMQYISQLGYFEKRAYFKNKKQYQERQRQLGSPDYNENYIEHHDEYVLYKLD